MYMHDVGVHGNMWTSINNCHQSIACFVVVNQTQSKWSPVNQEVCCLQFVNDLLCEQNVYIAKLLYISKFQEAASPRWRLSCIGLSPTDSQSLLNAFLFIKTNDNLDLKQ